MFYLRCRPFFQTITFPAKNTGLPDVTRYWKFDKVVIKDQTLWIGPAPVVITGLLPADTFSRIDQAENNRK